MDFLYLGERVSGERAGSDAASEEKTPASTSKDQCCVAVNPSLKAKTSLCSAEEIVSNGSTATARG